MPPSTPKPATPTPRTDEPLPKLDPLAGLCSYILPGLGQITQGRFSKGIVFLISIHALFFYGMYLGEMKNVYLPVHSKDGNTVARFLSDLYNRPHFAGQMFVGASAWPALVQYRNYDERQEKGPVFGTFQRTPSAEEINALQRNASKTWDLGWVYTVIAGVLNILVIYDAVAGPAFREVKIKTEGTPKEEAAKP